MSGIVQKALQETVVHVFHQKIIGKSFVFLNSIEMFFNLYFKW